MRTLSRPTYVIAVVCCALFFAATVLIFGPRAAAQDTQTSSQNSKTAAQNPGTNAQDSSTSSQSSGTATAPSSGSQSSGTATAPSSGSQSSGTAAAPNSGPSAQDSYDAEFPDGEGKQIFLTTCSKCHSPENVIGHGQNSDGWTDTLYKMIQYGAQGTNEDFGAIVYYLSNNFGPPPVEVNPNSATAMNLRSWLGFTKKQADAIVGYRKKHGDFKSLPDLKKVPGLDPKMIDAMKAQFTFAAPDKPKTNSQ